MGEKKKIQIPKSLTSFHPETLEQTLTLGKKDKDIIIGVPNETNENEKRVALVPATVATLVSHGCRVIVQSGAGLKANYPDYYYSEVGADIAYSLEQVLRSNVIIKISPFKSEEIKHLQPDTIVISPLQLPTLRLENLKMLQQKRVIAIAMEWMQDSSGAFPIVRITSELAGSNAISIGAELLTESKGVFLGGVTGVPSAKIVILGAGVIASAASRVASGLGAEIRVFDNDINKLMTLKNHLGYPINTSTLNPLQLEKEITTAELVIGALHSKSGRTPIIVSEEVVTKMKKGSIIIDVSIDQGGCFATSEVTTHKNPTFVKHDVIHYCVPNIAARVPRTASIAVSNILASLLIKALNLGSFERLICLDKGIANGVYTYKNCITNQYLGERFGLRSTSLDLLLASQL